MAIIDQNFVFAALDAEKAGEKFSINFDDVWAFSGYSRKDAALRFFKKCKYVKNIDFICSKHGGYTKNVRLTESCFKNWEERIKFNCKPGCDEKEIINKLAKYHNGVVEITTEVGRIDVLTNSQIIEVKKAVHWKQAVGQLLIYSFYYPKHIKRLHLFDMYDYVTRTLIETHCKRFDIVVTWEN